MTVKLLMTTRAALVSEREEEWRPVLLALTMTVNALVAYKEEEEHQRALKASTGKTCFDPASE